MKSFQEQAKELQNAGWGYCRLMKGTTQLTGWNNKKDDINWDAMLERALQYGPGIYALEVKPIKTAKTESIQVYKCMVGSNSNEEKSETRVIDRSYYEEYLEASREQARLEVLVETQNTKIEALKERIEELEEELNEAGNDEQLESGPEDKQTLLLERLLDMAPGLMDQISASQAEKNDLQREMAELRKLEILNSNPDLFNRLYPASNNQNQTDDELE